MLNRNVKTANVVTGLPCHNMSNLLTVTDAKNQTMSYTYDVMDFLATRKDALLGNLVSDIVSNLNQ